MCVLSDVVRGPVSFAVTVYDTYMWQADGRDRPIMCGYYVTPQPSGQEGYCHHGLGGRLPDFAEPLSLKPLNGFIPFEVLWHCPHIVVVQHHVHLILTLDFQGKILKMLYPRNGRANWLGTKGMWVDRTLNPHCDFGLWPYSWPWPLIFNVKFLKSRNSGMGCPIDMERKGCESTECWSHVVTFDFDLTHDLGLEFSMSNLEIAVSQEWEGRLTWSERDTCRKGVIPTLWPWAMTLTLDFQGQILDML